MARDAKWFALIRNLSLSIQAHLGALLDKNKEIMVKIADGTYHRNEGLLTTDNLELRDMVAEAKSLAREFQTILEDNDKTSPENERRILGRFQLKEKTR